jgi:homoserine kinase type II
MAVYTDVSFEELETLLAGYDVGAPQSFKGIAEGVENSNFFLQTDRGPYFLTLYEKRVRESDLPFFLGLLEHLAARGVACPLPVRDKQGKLWTTLNRRPAALVTFLNGVSLRRPEVPHCAEAGRALARLHAAGRDFPMVRRNTLSLAGWEDLASALGADADRVQPGLRDLIAGTLEELHAVWPENLPAGVIHADLFPDNVLFLAGHVSGLIDFYFACNDLLAYDLAVMVNSWCFEGDGAYNATKGRALIAAYRAARTMTEAEIQAFPVLARGAALRFLLTRAYDLINHDPTALVRPKEPKEFVKRLRFHAGTKNPAEYGFE